MLQCSLEKREFEFPPHFYIPFRTYNLEKGINPLITPGYLLSSIITLLLQVLFWHKITPEGWYSFNTTNPTKLSYTKRKPQVACYYNCFGLVIWFIGISNLDGYVIPNPLGLVGFYGISTVVGYLMLNPLYIHISNIFDLVWLSWVYGISTIGGYCGSNISNNYTPQSEAKRFDSSFNCYDQVPSRVFSATSNEHSRPAISCNWLF